MSETRGFVSRVLSHDCGPFWQFVKYGAIGVMSTLVQVAVFYLLAATCLACLKADDFAVRLLGFPASDASDAVRAIRFGWATAIGFVFSNVFCWLMNRRFVFRVGKFRWPVELALFMSVSGFAMLLATVLSVVLIDRLGLMTTLAVLIEVVVSFLLNYLLRKFVIFKG